LWLFEYLARCLVPASTFTASIPKSVGLTQPKKLIDTTSRIAEHQLNNCNQHRASPNTNSTTANNIAHRPMPNFLGNPIPRSVGIHHSYKLVIDKPHPPRQLTCLYEPSSSVA
jgi:hypothetical protein